MADRMKTVSLLRDGWRIRNAAGQMEKVFGDSKPRYLERKIEWMTGPRRRVTCRLGGKTKTEWEAIMQKI